MSSNAKSSSLDGNRPRCECHECTQARMSIAPPVVTGQLPAGNIPVPFNDYEDPLYPSKEPSA